MNDTDIEQAIVAAGKTAPRVTPDRIGSRIRSEHYFTAAQAVRAGGISDTHFDYADFSDVTAPLELLTLCVLVLENGFTVIGDSACVSPENFDATIGRKCAREKAINKIWELEGYLLRQRLHEGTK
ncbi:hypothetical protein V8N76_004568 [Salmonella enterica]